MKSTIKIKSLFAVVLLMIFVISTLAGCTSTTSSTASSSVSLTTTTTLADSGDASSYPTSQEVIASIDDYQDILDNIDQLGKSTITFDGDRITAGDGVDIDGTAAYITKAGTYTISGTSEEGRVVVYLREKGTVNLILNGLELSSSEGSPIAVKDAKEVIITLSEGTKNIITDNSTYIDPDSDEDAETAAVYSKDDLYIRGPGALLVYSEQKSGIQTKDQLIILEGEITVDAKKDAVKAKDYLVVEEGILNLSSGEDAIVATEDEDSEKGFVVILGGTFSIKSEQDGIQAETYAIINGGSFDIVTSGDSSESSKGIKAGYYIEINNGEFNIDSNDDSVHSDNNIMINDGSFVITSDDDGVHADAELVIKGGFMNITKSYEGLESRNVVINDGTIYLVSSDDGINIAAASSGNSRGGMMTAMDNALLKITGGYIYMDANGDGLDSNGDFYMSGGTVIVNGPLRSDNGGLDVNGECIVDGGYLAVAGSIGMAESPDQASGQNSVSIGFSSQLSADTLIYIESEDGEDIIIFEPSKAFQSFVFSSDKLKTGETYMIYTGGIASGESKDGLYDTIDDKGTLYDEFTISSATTSVGSAGSGGGMMGGGGRMGR